MSNYNEDNIKTLTPLEHIRLRPGMYIGRLGNGSNPEDGIYILLKETIDNCIDEFTMGHGKRIEVELDGLKVKVRDYGRGIPLGKLVECVSIINTGGKYDSESFKKSIGLNGVGQKAVNALSSSYMAQAFREGQTRTVDFVQGKLMHDNPIKPAKGAKNGTLIEFTPDVALFGADVKFKHEYVEEMLWNYAYLQKGLTLIFNGQEYTSKNGLKDLLEKKLTGEPRYSIVHLEGPDVELALTHSEHYGEEYYSFVNGQYTPMGGTHLTAFKEAYVSTLRNFYKKDYDVADLRQSIVAAISIRVMEPVFESQTKTKLGSSEMGPGGPTLKQFFAGFFQQLDSYLHKNPEIAQSIKGKIEENERERKELAGIRNIARDRAKKASLHNKKLRDCRIHLGAKDKRAESSTLFIVEGDSAAGSLTSCRDAQTQAVFALKGKPLNTFGLTKKVIYENEEFHLLQSALNIEDGLDNLRYNNIVIATDADVDGMHIRLLLLSFFIKFFPELITQGHVYILETPLFRVRNKKKTNYCYDEKEKQKALKELGATAEITRFKGLGEISSNEFKDFIGPHIRLDKITLERLHNTDKLLEFFMGKNTPDRQDFIVHNLKIEKDDLI